MEWKNQFKDYTTNLAFRLSLSKEMVLTMGLVRDYALADHCNASINLVNFGRFVPAVRCLIHRGLVTHHDKPADYKTWGPEEQKEFYKNHRAFRITEAGWAVIQLLELAELIPTVERKEKAA